MYHLKIVAPGFVGFTGQVGPYQFVEGLSVDPISKNEADRLSASVACVAVDADGKEIESAASPSQRVIDQALIRADVVEPLRTATQEEMIADQREAAIRAKHSKTVFYTGAELEAIAKKGGIKALREVADPWSVRHRSIPTLIELILAAQDAYKARNPDKKVTQSKGSVDEAGGRPVTPSTDPMLNITVDQLYAQQRAVVAPIDEPPAPVEEPETEEPAEQETPAPEPTNTPNDNSSASDAGSSAE